MPHVPRVICSDCGREMFPSKNGIVMEAILRDGDSYYKTRADEWECEDCGKKVVVGFGSPVPHFQENYASLKTDKTFRFRGE